MLFLAFAHVVLLAAPASSRFVPSDASVHLGVSLRVPNPADLKAQERALQDPASPEFHRWLSPSELGERFGQSQANYDRVCQWLESAGFTVTRSPNRIFVEATGSAGQAQALLGVRLRRVVGQPAGVRVPEGRPRLRRDVAPLVLHIAGLDTRVHHRRAISSLKPGSPTLGPQDLRSLYDVEPLLQAGYVGQGQSLVILGDALPPGEGPDPTHINYFFHNLSDASAQFAQDVLPNPTDSYYAYGNGASEFELDPEMQSVGAPGAVSITLVQPPSSEVFTTGINHIVTTYPTATAVSMSLGECEATVTELDQVLGMDMATATEQLIAEGTMEGQTWFASTGDFGADACLGGIEGAGTAAVDFPASVPEVVAVGGTQLSNPTWSPSQALVGYQQEVAWNQANLGAGGGGLSALFTPAPAYQQGLGLSARGIPDLSLISGLPGAGIIASPPGELAVAQGTSVASPLAAGFFALIASRFGCRLGDIHPWLYLIAAGQADGGSSPFRAITSGNNDFMGVTGYSAGPGYNLDTGLGSIDVAALAGALEQLQAQGAKICGAVADGGSAVPYDACATISCPAGQCTSIPGGPATCSATCIPNGSPCPSGEFCNLESIFADAGGGSCTPGCASDSDCAAPNSACSPCHACVPPGDPSSQIGSGCDDDSQCGAGQACASQAGFFDGGFCSLPCGGAACSCVPGSVCSPFILGTACLQTCQGPNSGCLRSDFLCQPLAVGGYGCTPPCTVEDGIDFCAIYGSSQSCNLTTGKCDGPPVGDGLVDGGFTSSSTSGSATGSTSGTSSTRFSTTGPTPPPAPTPGSGSTGGCGCRAGGDSPSDACVIAALVLLVVSHRRRALIPHPPSPSPERRRGQGMRV